MSEFRQAGSLLAGFRAKVAARHAWEAANPELAAAWNEAMLEDHQRSLILEANLRREQTEANIPARLRGLGVPDEAIQAFRAPQSNGPWEAAGKFLDSDKRFLALLGTIGTGKTVAAARVLAHGIRKGLEVHFVRATSFVRLSGYEDRAYFDRLCWAPVVVLDDLGTEHFHGFATSLFNEWLDCRYSRDGHRTVITGNLTKEAFRERYGERADDRIAQSGMLHVGREKSLRRKQP